MGRGRTGLYSEAAVKKAIEAIETYGRDQDAWEAIGIAGGTFYEWQKRHPDFRDAILKAKAEFRGQQLPNLRRLAKRALRHELELAGKLETIRKVTRTVSDDGLVTEREEITTKPVRVNMNAVQWALGTPVDTVEWVARGIDLGLLDDRILKIAANGYSEATEGIKQAITEGIPEPDGESKPSPGWAIAAALGLTSGFATGDINAVSDSVDAGSKSAQNLGKI